MNLYKVFLSLIIFISSNNFAMAEKYFGFESVSPYIIDKPFKMNSKEHQEQISQVILMQKNIDLIDIDQALEEKKLCPELIVNNVYQNIDRKKFPQLFTLLDRVAETSIDVTDGIKNYWKISRPYKSDKKVEMLISPSKGYSYPSGHTTGGYIYAYVMELLTPQKTEEFQDFAHQIAWHRVQVGMHYPQDLQGGKQLANFLIGGLMQNPQFQEDLKNAREELKKAGIV